MKLSRMRQFVVVVLCLSPLAFFATAKPAAAQSQIIAINAGGPAVSPFVADEDFSGGTTIDHANTINTSKVTNPAPAAVYQSARVTATAGAGTTFSYTIGGLTAGLSQLVRLHFAETFHTTAGSRVFNVSINGTQVLANFDIFKTAGGQNIANIQEFTEVANSSGQFVITFTSVTDKALISGIEIDSINSCSPPTAPSNLTATQISSSQINLSWTASTAGAGCSITYSVFRSTTSGFTPSSSNQIASGLTSTTFSDTTIVASTTYYYLVEGVDSGGSSGPSNQATPTIASSGSCTVLCIDSGSTTAVSPFVADEDFSGGATINHANTINTSKVTNPAPAAVYQSARVTATSGAGTTFSYTIGGLTAGTNYLVRLHFAETFHTTAGSRVFNVSINGTQVLTNFDIFATAGGQNIANIQQFTEAANSSGQFVIVFTTDVDKALISGIEIDSTSGPSCSAVPAAPSGLTATAASSSEINLSWSAVTPPANCAISSYSVFRGTTSGFTPSSNTLVGSTSGTTFSDTGLQTATTYFYVVEANDADGASPASAQVSVTTLASGGGVAPPTSLTAVGSSSRQIDLRWVASTTLAPNTAPVNYLVYRSTSPTFTPSSSNLLGTTIGITNYLDSNYPATLSPPTGPGVQPATTYFYQVVASTPAGTSVSASASTTSLPAAPSSAAPAELTGLTALAENANEIDLMWDSTNSGVGTAVTTYTIYRSTSPTFTPGTSNQIGKTKSNWFQDALATASTQYYYQVLAGNSLGASPTSTTVTAKTPALNPNLWGGAPFFDGSGLPAKKNVVMMKFLNRTNGKYTDSQIIWTATINGVASQFTIAQQPFFDMPANSAGRMYFYLNDPTLAQNDTNYWDFIEFTVGPTSINMDTTRVDAFGVKISFNLTCSDGTNVALGENEETFMEDRSITFQRYANDTPSTPGGNFHDDLKFAPFRIIEPGAAGFNAGGADQNYYQTYINNIWAFNGITIPKAGPNGSGLTSNPDLSAAIFRHSAPTSGTPEFNAAGNLTNQGMWGNPASFYQLEPYDHYAQWIEAQAINMQQYAFPYNDAGGYSSDIGCSNPQTLLVAIGW